MVKLNQEASNARQEDYKKIYRESAIKQQLEYLQHELDEMHPENVSDVRRFEKKIQESGMNETAEREACAMEHGISEDSFRKLAARYPLPLT